jgi:hypothetical protein
LSGVDTAIIRLENTDTTLVDNQLIGGLEFEKQDASGAGVGVVGGVRMYSDTATGSQSRLEFSTASSSTNDVVNMTILGGSGNVGIGTSSPSVELDVVGDGAFSGTLDVTGDLDVGSGALFVDTSAFKVGVKEASPKGQLHVSDGPHTALTPSTEADVFVVQAANVGGMTIFTGELDKGSIFFGNDGTSVGALIRHNGNSSTGTMEIGTNTAGGSLKIYTSSSVEAIVIDSSQNSIFSGNISIPSATDKLLLGTSGDGEVFQDTTGLKIQNTGSASDATSDVTIISDGRDVNLTATTGKITITGGDSTVNLIALTTTISADLAVDTNTLFVKSSSNRVGIGTVTPSTALDVVGDITASGTVAMNTLGVEYGANKRLFFGALSGGSIVIGNTSVTSTSSIFMTRASVSGTAGHIYVSSQTDGVGFTVTSTEGTDSGTFHYLIVERE